MPSITRDDVPFVRDLIREINEYDLKSGEDAQDYSNWLIAVATAGFALVLVRGGQFVEGTSAVGVTKVLMVSGALCSFMSAVVGGLVKYFRNKGRRYNRLMMTMRVGQYLLLRTDAEAMGGHDPRLVAIKVMAGTYLRGEDKDTYENHQSEWQRSVERCGKLVLIQQALVALAFVAIVVLFVMGL